MKQDELNQDMVDMGVARYRRNATTTKGSLTQAGRRIMRDGVEPVVLGLTESVEKIKPIRNKSRWQKCLAELTLPDTRALGLLAVKATLDVLDEPRS